MEYIFFWFTLSVFVGMFAASRGRSGFGWFMLAMLFSPLLALIFCALSGNLKDAGHAPPSEKTHVRCPQCAEFVLPQASICKHCSAPLTPDPQYVARNTQEAERADKEEFNSTIIGWSLLAGLGLLFWLFLRYK